MKKILLATSVLAATTGFAYAEVTVSGDARMGIVDDFGSGDDISFSSRARVKFVMTGTTDGGIEFGADFRAHDAGGANVGTAGAVYVAGNGFKISMGDVDGAANAAVGHVSGVGFTSLDDINESTFIGNGGDGGSVDPSVLAEYSAGAITGYFSVSNPGRNESIGAGSVDNDENRYSAAVKYSTDAFTVALGYEKLDTVGGGIDHIILGGSYTLGAATLNARYGRADLGATNGDQLALSVDYAAGATTVTAFYVDDEELGGAKAYGLGAAYDLGGGASIKGGYAKNDTADTSSFDLGVVMSF